MRGKFKGARTSNANGGDKRWHKAMVFPEPIEQMATDLLNDLYYKNIVYLLQLYIEDKSNLIFHLNANHSSKFAKELKRRLIARLY